MEAGRSNQRASTSSRTERFPNHSLFFKSRNSKQRSNLAIRRCFRWGESGGNAFLNVCYAAAAALRSTAHLPGEMSRDCLRTGDRTGQLLFLCGEGDDDDSTRLASSLPSAAEHRPTAAKSTDVAV